MEAHEREGKCTADTSLCQASCRSASAASALKIILKHFSYDSHAERLASYCNVLKHMVGLSAVGKTKINCFQEGEILEGLLLWLLFLQITLQVFPINWQYWCKLLQRSGCVLASLEL